MSAIPIIIAFPVEDECLNEIKVVNSKCSLKKGIDFNKVIPHLTLWMGFVSESILNDLNKEFSALFKDVSTRVMISGSDLYNGIDGSVLSLNISKGQYLVLLQNRIHHFFEPHRVVISNYSTFSKVTLDYINSFFGKSLEHYDPHITIGFTEEFYPFASREINFLEPKVFLAGNNCTCIEVID